METRICKTCRVDFHTFSGLELHQNATGHKGEFEPAEYDEYTFTINTKKGIFKSEKKSGLFEPADTGLKDGKKKRFGGLF